MDYEKYFLQSKTVIATLLAVAVQILPLLGVNFGADDAALITVAWDQIVTAVLGLLALYFRITATGAKLAVLPSSVGKNTVNSPWYVGIAALAFVLLAGCVTPSSLEEASPLEKVTATFDAAKANVDVYRSLPACQDGVVSLCSDPKIVAKLDENIAKVQVYVDALALASANGEATDDAAKAAQNQLRVLLTIYALQALSKV